MSTPDKEPIPEEFLRWAKSDAESKLQLPEGHSYGETSRYAQFVDDFVYGATTAYRHLSSQHKAAWGMRVKNNSGKAFEVHKYIKDAEGVEHVWCNEWYGHHGIGHDCEWASEETPSCQPAPGLRWNKIEDGQGPEEYIKVLLYWDGLQETDTGYLINNSWVNSSKEPYWALPSHWMPMPPKPGITPAPNCYPEGGGEGEEKPNLKDAITWLHHHAQRNGSQAESNEEEVYYQGYVDGLNELAKEMELSATEPAPEAQPIADGKEVPDHVMEFIGKRALKEAALHFHPIYSPDQNTACVICYTNGGRDIYRATRSEMIGSIQAGQIEASFRDKIIEELKADLLAARNKNNDDAIEIARLLAELKGCQENLTAMIDEALQKSKRLDEVEKEMRETIESIHKMHQEAVAKVSKLKDADGDDEFSELNYWNGQKVALNQALSWLHKISQK